MDAVSGNWLRACALLTLVSVSVAQAPAPKPASDENLNSVLWIQTAAEYRAIALQTYRAAENSLMRALADKNWTAALEQRPPFADLPPAVILDLDETVLDNSMYQARLAVEGGQFTDESWARWVAEQRAGVLPGAQQFLAVAHANGVAIFYVSNRTCDVTRKDDPTVRSVLAHRLPFEPGHLLCRTGTGDKSPRRAQIASKFRVVLLVGDDFNDFVSLPAEQSTVEGRAAAVEAYRSHWGERWFLLPNPMYGSWERALGPGIGQKREALRR